jgi:hypothetical protein
MACQTRKFMKLRDCVLMGLFCGLETVEECVANYDMHYLQCISYKEVGEDIDELAEDIKAWQVGELILDWDVMRKENAQAWKEYEDHCAKEFKENPELKEITKIDF